MIFNPQNEADQFRIICIVRYSIEHLSGTPESQTAWVVDNWGYFPEDFQAELLYYIMRELMGGDDPGKRRPCNEWTSLSKWLWENRMDDARREKILTHLRPLSGDRLPWTDPPTDEARESPGLARP